MPKFDKLTRIAVGALEDVKGRDIVVFDVKKMTAVFDTVIVATGDSNRQCRALANRVREEVKAAGGHVYSTEGEGSGEWVLVDLGDTVVHVMQPAIRQHYNLEELWAPPPKVAKVAKASKAAKPAKPAKQAKSRKSATPKKAAKPKAKPTVKAKAKVRVKPAAARKKRAAS